MVCMCKTPTNFKSDITNFVEFGCPEHNIFMRFDKENMNHKEFLEERKREKRIK